jgi:hypothetical protein
MLLIRTNLRQGLNCGFCGPHTQRKTNVFLNLCNSVHSQIKIFFPDFLWPLKPRRFFGISDSADWLFRGNFLPFRHNIFTFQSNGRLERLRLPGGHFELKIGGGDLSLNMRYLLGNLIELIFFHNIPEDYIIIHKFRFCVKILCLSGLKLPLKSQSAESWICKKSPRLEYPQ